MIIINKYPLFLLVAALSVKHCITIPINHTVCASLAAAAHNILEHENESLLKSYHASAVANFNHRINLSNTDGPVIDFEPVHLIELKSMKERFSNAGCDKLNDDNMRIQHQLNKFTEIGLVGLQGRYDNQIQNAINSMVENFASATVCEYKSPLNCGLKLKPHVEERLANSRDPLELAHYWTQWYDAAGAPVRDFFSTYVDLTRKSARRHHYNSLADYWLHLYDDPSFEANVHAAYNNILPLYRQIHAFVRYHLRQHYGDNVIHAHGNIPMHLLGDIYALKWQNTIDLYTPYPDKPFMNITADMLRQSINVTRMFQLGDEFFKSLQMHPLPDSFWNLSVLERPTNVSMVCNAASWDMGEENDVRISMCAKVNINDFYVVHHELGHIQYVLQYKIQPTILQGAPNEGFHEAVGDTIALSVNSPKHLERIGLLPRETFDHEHRINWLFKKALEKIPVLTYAYTLEKWRYAVFRNEINENYWNCFFWQMQSKFAGLEPPTRRTDFDFDPPAKYHVNANVEYLRYFAAHIFQFQFHKALCEKAGQYQSNDIESNLDTCDIYGSKEAGRALSEFLSLGTSKHWKKALQAFTGETTMNSAALLEYFKPLYEWLQHENERLGAPIGWDTTDKIAADCPPYAPSVDNSIFKM